MNETTKMNEMQAAIEAANKLAYVAEILDEKGRVVVRRVFSDYKDAVMFVRIDQYGRPWAHLNNSRNAYVMGTVKYRYIGGDEDFCAFMTFSDGDWSGNDEARWLILGKPEYEPPID